MDLRRAAILIVMDILLLSELTFSIWWAHFEPALVTGRFLQAFLPPCALTLLGTYFAFKRWAPKVQVSTEEARCEPWRPVQLFGSLGDLGQPRRES